MRRTSPALEAQVAAALAAGWPIVAIAEQTGISLSTVKRIRGRSGVRPVSMRVRIPTHGDRPKKFMPIKQ